MGQATAVAVNKVMGFCGWPASANRNRKTRSPATGDRLHWKSAFDFHL